MHDEITVDHADADFSLALAVLEAARMSPHEEDTGGGCRAIVVGDDDRHAMVTAHADFDAARGYSVQPHAPDCSGYTSPTGDARDLSTVVGLCDAVEEMLALARSYEAPRSSAQRKLASHPQCTAVEAPVTDAQARAILEQVAVYSLPATPCAGLASFRISPCGDVDGEPTTDGAVDAHFHYVYVEEERRGYEVTTFARSGHVMTSQDYG